ncbi:MAG TPA: sulfur carrier protein ThiS [Draconibacterium sp.]|nr:sulfur carrier protein ThiS [Draconibacterium sp.]
MNIKVNGKNIHVESSSISVQELLQQVGVESIEMVTVQLNGKFISKENLAATRIENNDQVDYLFFMGGGAFI